jgi:SAM-dependent methyltransferase
VSGPAYELSPCPACGGTEDEQVADADALREEVEALWEFHTERLQPGTPPERLVDRVAFSQRAPLRLARCTACGLLFRNPREREHELRDAYAGEEVDEGTLRALFETQRDAYAAQARRLTETAGRTGRGLEVGSYVGGFLAAAAREGWRFEGLDVNPATNRFARAQGHTVADGDLESFAGAGPFDAVAAWNCFDQLPDPRAAARRAHALLGPGGLLAVRVPNGAFYAAVRRHLHGPGAPLARALLAHNNLLAFPYRHGFTPASLRALLERAGFAVERVYGDTLVPIADEWTQGWAAWEERAVKGALRRLAGDEAERAPWMEVYARKGEGPGTRD